MIFDSRILKMLMKGVVLTLFWLTGLALAAQTPTWQWARIGEGPYDQSVTCVATDNAGNAIITGYFLSDYIVFGSDTLWNSTNNDSPDGFIVKYDFLGNVLWRNLIRGSNRDYALSVATDNYGYIYITGGFTSPFVVFGSDTLFKIGYSDMFLVKFDPLGNVIWAKNFGGTNVIYADIEAVSIKTCPSGDSYVAGSFYTTVNFGSYTLQNSGTGSTATPDIFLAKFDPEGNVLWAKKAGGNKVDWAVEISIDELENVYMTGNYNSPSINFDTTVLTNAGIGNVFLAKYDEEGNVIWVRKAGGIAIELAWAVVSDSQGNIIVCGWITSPQVVFGDYTLVSPAQAGLFLVKYNSSGTVMWARGSEGSDYNYGKTISVDASNKIFLAGNFQSPEIIFGDDTLTNMGGQNGFLARYDSEGNILWAKAICPGNVHGDVTSSCIDDWGNYFLTGMFFGPTATFDTIVLMTNYQAVFLAKLDGGNGPTVNIPETQKACPLKVYPNPADNEFTIETQQGSSLAIYNHCGQLVKSIGSCDKTNRIDVSRFPAGMYVIRVVNCDGVDWVKWIKR